MRKLLWTAAVALLLGGLGSFVALHYHTSSPAVPIRAESGPPQARAEESGVTPPRHAPIASSVAPRMAPADEPIVVERTFVSSMDDDAGATSSFDAEFLAQVRLLIPSWFGAGPEPIERMEPAPRPDASASAAPRLPYADEAEERADSERDVTSGTEETSEAPMLEKTGAPEAVMPPLRDGIMDYHHQYPSCPHTSGRCPYPYPMR